MKADLHQHLLIGFQDFWIKNQIGDLKKNLLEILIGECDKKDIGLCAITSQYLEPHIQNPEFELIHDRFEYLKREGIEEIYRDIFFFHKKECFS